VTTLTSMALSEPAATSFTNVMGYAAQAFEGLGALILTIGLLWSVLLTVLAWRRSRSPQRAYTALRQAFGAALLLGLEILVAADLIRTVAVAPTLDNVLVLGMIVLIRTFLSFSLEIEIDGVLPWQRAAGSGPESVRHKTKNVP
jgi:uncharacterized membrane protein